MSTQLTIAQTQLQSWAQIIKECKESGLKVNDYCSQHNLSRDAYYYWYGKVKKEFYSQQSGFVEIPADLPSKPSKITASEATASSEKIEIHCGKFTITIPSSSSAEVISKILEAVNHAE